MSVSAVPKFHPATAITIAQTAVAAGADVLVTGESGYNAAEDAAESSFCTVEAGHYHTEAPVLDFLDLFIRTAAPEITTEKFDSCAYRTI